MGWGEDGIMAAATVVAIVVVFFVAGAVFNLKGWPLALLGVGLVSIMGVLTALKFKHVHERRMKLLDAEIEQTGGDQRTA